MYADKSSLAYGRIDENGSGSAVRAVIPIRIDENGSGSAVRAVIPIRVLLSYWIFFRIQRIDENGSGSAVRAVIPIRVLLSYWIFFRIQSIIKLMLYKIEDMI